MIELRDVCKRYTQGSRALAALDGVSARIERGEFVAVTGKSGSGKSTFLHLCGALDLPTSGSVIIDGVATKDLNDNGLTLLRRHRIGFVFQFFNLVPSLTVAENVALPLVLAGSHLQAAAPAVDALLERVGLSDRRTHLPEQLSGGEMQRVALARALVTNPPIILADEPTGNLDSETGSGIFAILAGLAPEHTVVMVTHDAAAAALAGREIKLRDGRLA